MLSRQLATSDLFTGRDGFSSAQALRRDLQSNGKRRVVRPRANGCQGRPGSGPPFRSPFESGRAISRELNGRSSTSRTPQPRLLTQGSVLQCRVDLDIEAMDHACGCMHPVQRCRTGTRGLPADNRALPASERPDGAWTISAVHLRPRAKVLASDDVTVSGLAAKAKAGCPDNSSRYANRSAGRLSGRCRSRPEGRGAPT